MARGGASPVPSALPVVSFTKIDDEFSSKRISIPEQSIRAYGFFKGQIITLVTLVCTRRALSCELNMLKSITEPLESELAVQVEYDMDEQDQCWLDALNIERRAKSLGSVPYEVFEIVMDRLEKEWFDLTKNIPKPDLAMPSEDSTCAICDDSEGENTNAIVFCDGCNLAVHQDCYGVPYIPEGQWLCRKCTVSPENPVSCILCPNEGGAFKQTTSGEWVHLLCAIWVPETRVANDVFMEPVIGVDKISKQRWKLKCSICDIREGACIQCIKSSCFLAFHATCARKEKLLMPMKSSQGSEAPTLACYCEKHLPPEQAAARTAALAAEHSETATHNDNDPQAVKSARAYAKTYKPGPPLVPQIIVRRIEQYIQRLNVRHKHEFVVLTCKYWSLKREARRGAPLLKRLHLEPWTASVGGKNQSDEEKVIKLEHAKRVRQDLENLKNLVTICRRREGRKLQQQHAIEGIFSQIILSKQPPLRMAFEDIMAMDKNSYFKEPVSKTEVPDYYDIIKNPICWNTIDQKLDRYEYWDLEALKADIHLVLGNAMIYNKADTPYWRTAQRIKNASEAIFANLDQRINPRNDSLLVATEDQKRSPSVPSEPVHTVSTTATIGDIEPSLELLELLLAQETIGSERAMKYVLEQSPIEALFSFELGTLKPPPSPPPPPPAPPSPPLLVIAPKPKRDRKAEKERRRRLSELDTSPGFRANAPRTRRALAAVAAFEAEASGQQEHEQAEVESPDSATHPVDAAMAVDGEVPGPEAEAQEESAIVVPSKRKHKRAPITLPGHSEVPPVVDNVDNQRSFKMFDEGWILPDDHRRGGRAPVERQPLPEPKKKKSRTEREKSHLSVATTSPAQNETLLPFSASMESMELRVSVSPQAATSDLPTFQTLEQKEQAQNEQVLTTSPTQMHPEDVSTEESIPEPDLSSAGPFDESMPQDTTPLPGPEVDDGADPAVTPPQAAKHEAQEEEEEEEEDSPPRIIIIEELDTPATRREKNMRRKVERLRLAAEAAALREAEAQEAEDPEANATGSREEKDGGGDDVEMASQSDLTSLGSTHGESDEEDADQDPLSGSLTPVEGLPSEMGADDEDIEMAALSMEEPSMEEPSMEESTMEEPSMEDSTMEEPSMSPVTPTSRQRARTKKQKLKDGLDRGRLKLGKGQFLEGGTLVWAKLPTYPWWPAVVFEPDDPNTDVGVSKTRTPQEIKKQQLHLVRFYDNRDYWRVIREHWPFVILTEWMEPEKMRMLGEDKELDEDMLASSSSIQKWKKPRQREALRKSYRRAMAEMETGGADEQEASEAS
ncbi:hypothetical protein EIP86_006111 [Pleurotus ostreatoroseus]|nr:hypothetical protein EIP86_006111 [Pleurotus ostreatoroseus]